MSLPGVPSHRWGGTPGQGYPRFSQDRAGVTTPPPPSGQGWGYYPPPHQDRTGVFPSRSGQYWCNSPSPNQDRTGVNPPPPHGIGYAAGGTFLAASCWRTVLFQKQNRTQECRPVKGVSYALHKDHKNI